jgi:two-component system cell cycle sensor histidine kinase PleC
LRTPLNAILGFSDMIASEATGPGVSPRYREYATDIHDSGTHLLSLINDLLDVAKIEAGRMEIDPQWLDAFHVFNTVHRLMSAKARARDQELLLSLPSDAPPLFADERAFKQIALNLISNAIKFSPNQSRITMSGRLAGDGGFLLVVEDTGAGIPPEKLDKIFSPFCQVDNRYDRQSGGTGLGLALVHGLAGLHGGRAWLESALGAGTRAYVHFPLAKIVAEPLPERRASRV